MLAFKGMLSLAGVLATLISPAVAQAQTASGLVKSASIASAGSKPGIAGKWTCLSAMTVEIAPVSFDTRGLADAWVVVHRDKGEIVAAQRISGKEVEQVRRLPCGAPDSNLGGVALVG